MSGLKRVTQTMPKLVKDALIKEGLESAYEDRPPYQRNDYLMWINNAKKDDTKERRLKKMLGELKQGNGYMGMKWCA
ncbi:YdeI/OmpD-associated family protein [Pararhizobium sp. IMCC21322]|uniref:YdeI/OmpD-associated family protein n=1 Tax=Pararhizobium sp. IMCC21322 TaxID=3067903 RepID=UPI002740F9FE|nr:YdeI/OmpD-associated family protein [Pararhizobium sp. IMCC21322]